MAPDLEQLLVGRQVHQKHNSAAARAEAQKRQGMARDLATVAVVNLHRDDYRSLYQQALAKVNAERGPLPE